MKPFFAKERMKEDLISQKLATIIFSDDDLLLGTTEYYLLFYVIAESNSTCIK